MAKRGKTEEPLDTVVATDDPAPQRSSRSESKRDAKALMALAERLVALRPDQLARLPLDDAVRIDVAGCQGLRRGALRRQLKHLAGTLRREDWRAIAEAVES